MKWKKYTIQTTTEAEDFISMMLNELGIEGIEIEDKVPLTEDELDGMFIDFPPELGEDDGTKPCQLLSGRRKGAYKALKAGENRSLGASGK